MADPNFIIVYVDNPLASAKVYEALLGKPPASKPSRSWTLRSKPARSASFGESGGTSGSSDFLSIMFFIQSKNGSERRPVITTLAPPSANSSAFARPMPALPHVMITTLSFHESI